MFEVACDATSAAKPGAKVVVVSGGKPNAVTGRASRRLLIARHELLLLQAGSSGVDGCLRVGGDGDSSLDVRITVALVLFRDPNSGGMPRAACRTDVLTVVLAQLPEAW